MRRSESALLRASSATLAIRWLTYSKPIGRLQILGDEYMKKAIVGIAASAALVQASPAYADATCSGTFTSVHVQSNGAVLVHGTYRNTYTQICNIKDEWQGVTPDVCAVWTANAGAAVSMGRTVRVYYSGAYLCESLPTYYSSPPPFYVMLL